MPVEWGFAEGIVRLAGVDGRPGGHIRDEDAERQEVTARAILDDLARRPGVVLADEVGMGKTYVALAVMTSVLLTHGERGLVGPIVVMVPPGLVSKWKREWTQFKARCCEPAQIAWVRDREALTPTAFFKALDDPRRLRPHIIWTTTRCFWRGLDDALVKLAFIRLAREQTKLSGAMKDRLFKWAKSLVRLKSAHLGSWDVEWLLSHSPAKWNDYLRKHDYLGKGDDDPIPKHLLEEGKSLEFGDQVDSRTGERGLATLLRDGTIPGKTGAVSSSKENDARRQFNDAFQSVYRQWIRRSRWRCPLLVMDEAHHAKNDDTRLARLFRSKEASELLEVDKLAPLAHRPLLWEKFDRMLFLTATPFQLGHHELIRVLRSFAAANWTGPTAPDGSRHDFLKAVTELETRLNENLHAARRLDRLWGRLAKEAVGGDGSEEAAANWWREVSTSVTTDPTGRELQGAIEECRRTKAVAERDEAMPWRSLRQWVIRHNRSRHLNSDPAARPVPRRRLRAGEAVATDGSPGTETDDLDHGKGLRIADESMLPFLLAARAQGEVAHGSSKGRVFFAEGLCSSYEAFHHTRDRRGDARDLDDDGVERPLPERRKGASSSDPVAWYEGQVERVIPSKKAPEVERYRHPKIQPVVKRVVDLWESGEKVLVFCFYRQTARALRDHIGREIQGATRRLAAERLGLPAGSERRVTKFFESVAKRLLDEASPFHKELSRFLSKPLTTEEFAPLRERVSADELVPLLAAYVRSPSFIARYFPLDVPEVRRSLLERSTEARVAHRGAEALVAALAEPSDGSAMSLGMRVEEFLRFVKELADERQPTANGDDGSGRLLDDYLKAIAVQTSGKGDEEADRVDAITFRVQQPVRMVFGDTKRETRERLMLAFNSPMFPEVLISSAVLSEGIDLHRFCRYVIHHDLCWNPSTLEQRTGRVDRIRSRAEMTSRPVVVYQPFLAGSADERMYRVVRDRERWFQVVMGEKFEFDESTSEQLAHRVPLPEELAKQLVFNLRRHEA